MKEMQEIELSAEQAEDLKRKCNEAIDLETSLDFLMNNKHFKKVFMEHYSVKEASRLVGLLGDQTINLSQNKDEYRQDFHERMVGIARFNEYLRQVKAIATQSRNTLEQLNNSNISVM